jgi:hypothetical protein
MNFDFSDEQKQLRDEARKFLAEKCPPKTVRMTQMTRRGGSIFITPPFQMPSDASQPVAAK